MWGGRVLHRKLKCRQMWSRLIACLASKKALTPNSRSSLGCVLIKLILTLSGVSNPHSTVLYTSHPQPRLLLLAFSSRIKVPK